jgi:hypothetical protein
MRIGIALLRASVIAAAVFALAWIRIPMQPSRLGSVVSIFIGYGIFITIFAFLIGFPLTLLLEKYRLIRWWSSTAVSATVGALLAGIVTYRPTLGPDEIENPMALTFSPWNRKSPGFIDNIPLSQTDFVGSVAFGAIVGAALGLAFWYFYSRASRSAA